MSRLGSIVGRLGLAARAITRGDLVTRGTAIRAAAQAYEAASIGRRLGNWRPSGGGASWLAFANAEELRRRERERVRNDVWARTGLGRVVASMIGTGIKPMSGHPDAGVRRYLHDSFAAWTDEAIEGGETDYYGWQSLVCRSAIEAGEALGQMLTVPLSEADTVPLRLRGLEADHLPLHETRPLPNGNVLIAGIEIGRVAGGSRRRVAYHLLPEHPGEMPLFDHAGQTIRVPAEHVIHHYEPERLGQLRGVTPMCATLVRLFDLDEYEDAVRVRQKISAMFSGLITEGAGAAPGPLGETGTDGVANQTDEDGVPVVELEPGTFQKLQPGEQVSTVNLPDVGANQDRWLRQQLLGVAAGQGLTYAQLTGDLSDVNFSSLRGGLLEVRRAWEQRQHAFFAHQVCRPVWRRFLIDGVVSGRLDLPDFRRDLALYLKVDHVPQGWQWVDPKTEGEAEKNAIRSGLTSRRRLIMARGFDPEQIDEEIAADNARADRLGLVLDSDPRHTANPGAGPGSKAGNGAGPDQSDDARGDDERRDGGRKQRREVA